MSSRSWIGVLTHGHSSQPTYRHSREGGLRFTSAQPNIQRVQRHLSRERFGVAEHPETSNVLARKALDSRVRGNDGRKVPVDLAGSIRALSVNSQVVIPAKAGI
ncbi:hypothetical protein [Lysobacter gummosus]|uniref:hypothetical protein n=1 Tax=Lysobacter gummosus TaxID=262324 RepID=UPI003633F661